MSAAEFPQRSSPSRLALPPALALPTAVWYDYGMPIRVFAADRPELPAFAMPDRFRHDVSYFMSVPGEGDVPQLPSGDYWVRLADARRWLDEGVLSIVSPLDSENRTEIEITEEQEDWLRWMVEHGVEHVRLG